MSFAIFPKTKIFLSSYLFPHLRHDFKRKVIAITGFGFYCPVEHPVPLRLLIGFIEKSCLGRAFQPAQGKIILIAHAKSIAKRNTELFPEKGDVVIKYLLLQSFCVSRDNNFFVVLHCPKNSRNKVGETFSRSRSRLDNEMLCIAESRFHRLCHFDLLGPMFKALQLFRK